MMKKLLLRIAIYLLVSTGFCAEIYVQDILYDYNEIQLVILEQAKTVVTMAAKKSIVHAVEKHNSLGLVMDEILRRDKRWMSSHNTEEFKIKLQENISGVILKSMVLRNRAMYSEAFLTGNKGANVGAYPATSDYWQGDEDKFKIAFNNVVLPEPFLPFKIVILPGVSDKLIFSNIFLSSLSIDKSLTINIIKIYLFFDLKQ